MNGNVERSGGLVTPRLLVGWRSRSSASSWCWTG
jgi:hypothetical protein